jgi:coiled-coil domain-containing protein 130
MREADDYLDTEAPSAADAPADPFAHIEKTVDQATWAKTNTTRISELSHISDRQSFDPYLVSSALRRRFRQDKKIALEKQLRDDGVKGKYGLHDDVDLGGEDVELGREMWEAQREAAGLAVGPAEINPGECSTRAIKGTPVTRRGKGRAGDISTGTPDLGSLLRKTTAKKYDPFSDGVEAWFSGSPNTTRGRSKVKEVAVKLEEPEPPDRTEAAMRTGMAVLAGYDSD